MTPKRVTTSTPKKTQSPLRQGTLSFKSTKRGAAAPSKAKAKTRAKAKVESKAKSPTESEREDEGELEDSESEEDRELPLRKEVLDMDDKAGIYSDYYKNVREKMGFMAPLHSEGQSMIHTMLRVYDNTMEYGPCVGITRLERWERAQALGLDPPIEVRKILLTEQGSKELDLVHPVFFGQVL